MKWAIIPASILRNSWKLQRENLQRFPVIIPATISTSAKRIAHFSFETFREMSAQCVNRGNEHADVYEEIQETAASNTNLPCNIHCVA